MKNMLLLIAFAMLTAMTNAQNNAPVHAKPENNIRQYYFVMLLKGPNRNQDSATAAKIQEGHMANINRLYNEGKLKVAGPFGDDTEWLGIFIFDCDTREELETLLKTDPAIAAGRIKYDIHPWYTAPVGSFKPGKPTANP
ncbi:MAG TPA: YciI family protein [Chitinophagaceae bacterium]|nr:YciI family protein [Chitinophagaceae bacterium]